MDRRQSAMAANFGYPPRQVIPARINTRDYTSHVLRGLKAQRLVIDDLDRFSVEPAAFLREQFLAPPRSLVERKRSP